MKRLAELTYGELLRRAAPHLRAADVLTGAMVALVPSEADAARLAVDGGEAAEQLHVTLVYLGEAADIPTDARARIIDRVRSLAADRGPVVADGFAVSMFNPTGPAPCVVLGLSGAEVDAMHDAAVAAVAGAFAAPEQHRPWVAHITLEYTADPGRVEALVNHAGPVNLDRLRVAFAGEVTDFPLGGNLRRRAAPFLHLRYSEDQERDDNGRFAGSGGGGGGSIDDDPYVGEVDEGDYGYGRDSNGVSYTEDDVDQETGEPKFLRAYRDKYGPIESETSHETTDGKTIAVVEPSRGKIHIADDSAGTKEREVIQELSKREAGQLGDAVWAAYSGEPRASNAIRLSSGITVSPVDPSELSLGVNVQWSSGRVDTFAGAAGNDAAFDLQESLDLSAGSASTRSALRSRTRASARSLRARAARYLRPPLHVRYSEDQERDENGRFGSGGGSSSSTGKSGPGGVRQQLMESKTTEQIELTTRQELRAITGHTVEVHLDGLEPQLAREYAEGVLRGAERFPDANLTAIRTADTASYLPGRVYAHASPTLGEITFDNTYTASQISREIRMANLATIASSGRAYAGPEDHTHAATGTHEFAHLVHGTDSNVQAATHATIKGFAADNNLSMRGAAYTISEYAADSTSEALAEALVDVTYNNGGGELSRALVALLPGGSS